MKKIIVNTVLALSLICSGAALAVTKRANLYTTWNVSPGASFEIPIEFKADNQGDTAEIMLTSKVPMCVMIDNCPKPANVTVLFNGKPVFHGENVAPGQTIFFRIVENGVLTIKNLNNEDPADGSMSLSTN